MAMIKIYESFCHIDKYHFLRFCVLFVFKMERYYCNRDYVDMLKLLGACNDNATAAARAYAERFPNRRHPDAKTIRRVEQRLLETGNLNPRKNQAGRQSMLSVDQEEQILEFVEAEPSISLRIVSSQLHFQKNTIHRLLRRNGLYPFRPQKVQVLHDGDRELRVNFCRWLLHSLNNDPHFIEKILWSDESTFTEAGIINTHNLHEWKDENPHLIRNRSYQRRWSINIWAGLLNNNVIGPYILPNRLNSALYNQFLNENLPLPLLDEVPLASRLNCWFQHDGAPAHYGIQVRNLLNELFPERWIGRGGPIQWPPRSPDLNPLDFFFWGYLKEKVYREPVVSPEDVIARIHAAVALVDENMLQSVRASMIHRANVCLEVGGNLFEHIL